MERLKNRVVTALTLTEDRIIFDKPLRIGDTVQDRIAEKLDMRPFGQLRTWLGDPPSDEEDFIVSEGNPKAWFEALK